MAHRDLVLPDDLSDHTHRDGIGTYCVDSYCRDISVNPFIRCFVVDSGRCCCDPLVGYVMHISDLLAARKIVPDPFQLDFKPGTLTRLSFNGVSFTSWKNARLILLYTPVDYLPSIMRGYVSRGHVSNERARQSFRQIEAR